MTIEELTTLDKLNDAFYQCAKASNWKETTQRYRSNLLFKNIQLQKELRDGTYKVQPTYNFKLKERGKERDIKAPSIRDRIVQKVLMHEVLVPNLTKPLIYDNYASLKNRGTTMARKRVEVMLRRYIRKYGSEGYVLQIDIRKYFDSIDHEILKRMVHERIKESKEIMDLIDYIIDTSSDGKTGLNLGSEAPQIFAIYYLHRLDSYVKVVKGVKFYGRYMDDIFILHPDKAYLQQLLIEIKDLLSTLKLQVHPTKTHIVKLTKGFTFLQIKYNIYDRKIIKRPTRPKIVRERRRLKKHKNLLDTGRATKEDICNWYKSWRQSIVKDCNRYLRTIKNLDNLFYKLFGVLIGYTKSFRTTIVLQIYKEVTYEDCRHQWQRNYS